MKSITTLLIPILLIYLLQSCNSAPDAFTKGYEFYTSKNYDSSLYYFDRLLPEHEDWLDSAKAMKIKCFQAMTKDHKWDMLGAANSTYGVDSLLINEGAKYLEKELVSIWKKDSMDMLYRIIDQHKTKLPSSAITAALNGYEESVLSGYEWLGSRSMKGQKLYFVREIAKDWKGNDEGNKIQGKSNRSINGWTKNNIIYRNIAYDSAGIYHVQPRIFKGYGSRQYFSSRGSMRIISKDTLKINYEQRLKTTSRVYFIRGDKLEAEDLP